MNDLTPTSSVSAGTATFLFTDIERSTEMWERHRSAMPRALERHDGVLRDVIAACGGKVFKEVGDAFHARQDVGRLGGRREKFRGRSRWD